MRGLAILPGLVAVAFIGHAIEDAGIIGAIPYIVIILLSVSYLIRPMVILWVPLFCAFVMYTLAVAIHPENGPRSEWIVFVLLGFVPAVLLCLARPRALT